MDYEKKYKELIEKIELISHSALTVEQHQIIDTILGELKESEDEKVRKALVEMVHDTTGDELWVDYNVHKEEVLAWLEKQGEQKPAWTKEDDVRLQACIDTLQAESLMGKVDTVMTNWLKSLKTRCTWKPSDEQIGVIESVINNRPCKRKHVNSLYNDLKKLREDKL